MLGKHMLMGWVVVMLTTTPAEAQWREGQPAVVEPPAQRRQELPDHAAPFRSRYLAAKRPRIVLFWNREFDDQTETETQDVTVKHKTMNRDYDSLQETTHGKAGDATHVEGDEHADETVTRTRRSEVLNSSKRNTDLSARDSAQLESAFREEMGRGGVAFVDRATIMRMAQAEEFRGGADPRLIEADAVAGRAELLLEVLMLPDKDAPIGWAFQVSVKDIKKGTQTLSFYTNATPSVPQIPGHWAAGANGYEWSQPQAQAGIADVGSALADDVMRRLGPVL